MKNAFNLLKPQVEPPTVWSKLYDWITGTARIIVIFVELIVVAAFAIRVVIDVQAKNLDMQVSTAESTVGIFRQAEERYRFIQSKTKTFNDTYTQSPTFVKVIDEINANLPVGATEISVQISGNSVVISGSANDASLGAAENAYKSSNFFSNVELKRFETGKDSELSGNFSFNLQIRDLKLRTFPTPTPIVTPAL